MPEPTDPHPKVVDLMEALQQSVDEARAARKAHRQAHQPPDEAEVEDEGYPAAYPEPSGARVIAPCGNVASAYTVPALGLCPANRAVRWAHAMRVRSYWCSRGGLIAVVKATSHHEARALAARAFRRGAAHRLDDTVVRVRRASRADVALFEQEAGPDGAQVGAVAVDSTQEAMF